MNVTFTRIYALIVCLGAVLCITISSGIGLHAVVTAIHPPLLMSTHEYAHLRSNNAWRSNAARCQGSNDKRQMGYDFLQLCSNIPPQEPGAEPLSDAEVEGLRAEGMALKISDKRHGATASLIRVAIALLISIPIFFVHWRIAQKYKTRSDAATQ